MRNLRTIARDTGGASFIIGLMLFLVCATVASVVITSASVNTRRAEAVQHQQQSYFAVSSAAQLFATDMQKSKPALAGTVTTRTYSCPYHHDDAGVTTEALALQLGGDDVDAGHPSPLMQMIQEANDHFATYPDDGAPFAKDFELDLSASEVTAPVEGVFRMQPPTADEGAYSIAIELRTDTAAMVVSVPANVPEQTTAAKPAGTCSHDDVWNWSQESYLVDAESIEGWAQAHRGVLNPETGSYEPASNEFGHASASTYDMTESTETLTISWGAPTISKREVA